MNQADKELRKGINDLPDEMLQKVLQYMDYKTLMTSTLVCKKWNGMIGHDSAIMKKIKLVFTIFGDLDMPKDLTRTYHTIEIRKNNSGYSDYDEITPNIKNFWTEIFLTMEHCARNLRVLIIQRCRIEIEEINKLNKLFAALTNLESLNISTKFFPSNKLDLSPLVCMKSLYLNNEDAYNIRIRKFPGTSQLKSLQIRSYMYSKRCGRKLIFDQNNEYSECLIDYLARQKSLEDLKIGMSDVSRNFNLEKLNAINFPLKRLALYKYDNNSDRRSSDENLLLFMSKFVNSLEELYILRKFPESFYEMIFMKFRKLNTLSVFVNEAPTDDAFYRRVQPNTSIRNLIVDGLAPKDNRIQRIIGNLPNIQTLDLNHTELSKELMTFISYNLRMLVKLDVKRITHQAFVDVTISSLKSLSIEIHNKPIEWKEIVKATPNIEVFAVLHFIFQGLLNEENIKIMAKGWPQLRHVKLGCEFVASKEIFDLFLCYFKNLKIVECFESAFKTIPDKKELLDDFNGITFIIRRCHLHSSFKTLNHFHEHHLY